MTTNVTVLQDIYIRNIPVKRCRCKSQKCKGKYIPSRPDQKYCLFEIWRLEEIYETTKTKI